MNRFSLPIALALFFTSCSWREYFVVINSGTKPCRVTYVLDTAQSVFPIFDRRPSVYPLTGSGAIEWGRDMAFADEDSSANVISIQLPPNSALVLGELANDHYDNSRQQFINGRKFNLHSISIGTLSISASSFDHYFKKKNGNISYEVK